MNQETIELLAMDYALGELTDEAKALFEAYVADHPEAKVWADAMMQMCDVTRESVERQTEVVVKAADGVSPKRAAEPWWGVTFIRWAAVWMVGFLCGYVLFVGAAVKTVKGPAGQDDVGQVQYNVVGERVADVRDRYKGSFWEEKIVVYSEDQPIARVEEKDGDGGFWSGLKSIRR